MSKTATKPLYAEEIFECQRRLTWLVELKAVNKELSSARYSDYDDSPNPAVGAFEARRDELKRRLWPEVYGEFDA